MRHLDLFSGIGGFALAARWMNWETVQFVEIDKFCQKVLQKNFPNIPIHDDIKTFDGTRFRGTVDIVTGGFPCQPFSTAGKRKGTKDDRYLWPEMLRVIREVQPAYVVGENVYGLLSLERGLVFEQVCADLENEGYQVQAFVIPACAVNAPHRRDRVWIVAHADREHRTIPIQQRRQDKAKNAYARRNGTARIAADFECERLQEQWERRTFKSSPTLPNIRRSDKPGMGRGIYGVPNRVDRIKSLGNGVVPEVVFEIFKAIEEMKGIN